MNAQLPGDLPLELKRVIPSLKEQNPHLFLVSVLNEYYIVRGLTWGEYKRAIEAGIEPIDAADKIVQRTLLWPDFKVLQKRPAGVVDTLAAKVLDASGFTDVKTFLSGLKNAREATQDLEHLIVIAICRAFPAYKPNELLDFDFHTLMEILSMAEKIIDEEIRLGAPGETKQDIPITPGHEAFGQESPYPKSGRGKWQQPIMTPPPISKEELLDPSVGRPDFTQDIADFG